MKVEGSNPAGSFKDSRIGVGITKAMELGVATVGCASAGHLGITGRLRCESWAKMHSTFTPPEKVALVSHLEPCSVQKFYQ